MAKNVARGSLLGMLGQGWHLMTAFLLYAYLARTLGPGLFGRWSVVLSLLAWFEVFVTSALVKVVTKEISESPGDAPRITRAAYLGQAAVASVVFIAVIVAAGPIAGALRDSSLAPLIRISALDIPLYGLFMIASAVVLGMQRYERQGVAWIVYATAKAGFIAALVAAGFSVPGALVGNALSSLVGFAALFIITGANRDRLAELWPVARRMLVASVPFLILSLIAGVGQYIDLWLVSGLVADDVTVGHYASATVLAEIPVFLFLGLNRVLFPSVVSANAAGDGDRADRYAAQAVRTGIIVSVMAVALVASAGRQVIEIVYSSTYLQAFIPLVLLMVAGLGRTIQATGTEVLMAQGRRRAALWILAGTVITQAIVVAVLTEVFGPDGAAAGTAVTALGAALLVARQLRSALGLGTLATLARAVGAAALVGGTIALLEPAPLLLLVVLPVAVAAYAGLLLAFREFTPGEIASIRTAIGRQDR
ncbi:MAG: oligosaccharide flippase family protein [Coriobacteriia bacterium]|nr:oligosaccharide flippase family protein [Coriobacteriia bacterium]